MSNLVTFAKEEFAVLARVSAEASASKPDALTDKMQASMEEAVLQMVEVFSTQGHSGFSASVAIGYITRLLQYQPLSPLTGEVDEWVYHEDSKFFQNKRSYNVFKEADGRAYNIDGIVFREPDGSTYTNSESRVYIEFPYWPAAPDYRDVPAQQEDEYVPPTGNTCEYVGSSSDVEPCNGDGAKPSSESV